MAAVFLSYAREDQVLADRLAKTLTTRGLRVHSDCLDKSQGVPLLKRLMAVKPIDFVLLVISHATVVGTLAASDWRDALLDNFLHGRTWLIGIQTQDCELPEFLTVDCVEDFRDTARYAETFKRLTKRLELARRAATRSARAKKPRTVRPPKKRGRGA